MLEHRLKCCRVDINNVGSISQALYAEHSVEYDEVESAQLQALQVSTISIMNCVGRIGIGISSHFLYNISVLTD